MDLDNARWTRPGWQKCLIPPWHPFLWPGTEDSPCGTEKTRQCVNKITEVVKTRETCLPPDPGVPALWDAAAAAAKSLQSCLTLCDPIDSSPPGSPVPGILQARTLEWVTISFSNAWKWKVKVKSLSCVRLLMTPWTVALQAILSMGFSRQEYWSGLPFPSPLWDGKQGKNISEQLFLKSHVGHRETQEIRNANCRWFIGGGNGKSRREPGNACEAHRYQCWRETLRSHSHDLETLMTQLLQAAGPHGQAVSSVCFPHQGQPTLPGTPGKRVREQQWHWVRLGHSSAWSQEGSVDGDSSLQQPCTCLRWAPRSPGCGGVRGNGARISAPRRWDEAAERGLGSQCQILNHTDRKPHQGPGFQFLGVFKEGLIDPCWEK